MIKWKNKNFVRAAWTSVRCLARRYRRHEVSLTCAALTYYLVFAAFPLLVLLGTLPGALGLESEALLDELGRFVPRQVTDLVGRYWADVAQNGGKRLLWSSAVFTLWLPLRAADCLGQAVRRAFGMARPRGLRHKLRTLLFTLWLTVTLPLVVLLITVGRRALGYVTARLGLPSWVAGAWNGLRFVLLGLVMAAALTLLYLLALGRRRPLRQVLPGVAASLAAWMALSVGFSYYVEYVAGYTLLYGSVAAVVVTLLWLYLSAMALVMGAEYNALLCRRRYGRQERKDGS